eukprot:1144718-Pelagomonas_calceolata.AAC.1
MAEVAKIAAIPAAHAMEYREAVVKAVMLLFMILSSAHEKKRKKKKKNYVGRVTLPSSIKEKEAHWLIKSREPPPPRDKKERLN